MFPMTEKKPKGCIRTAKDETSWRAWTEDCGIHLVTVGHVSRDRALSALMADLRQRLDELQQFVRYPTIDPEPMKEDAK